MFETMEAFRARRNPCCLGIRSMGPTDELGEAWSWLPDRGEGIVVLADKVARYDPLRRTGLLLEADVSTADATVRLRLIEGSWQAWTWTQSDGDTHLYADTRVLSSESGSDGRGGCLVYRRYWTREEEDGVRVWKPCGARFLGFAEG